MLYNFLKIAFRNLLRHKVYSCINIFGLAIAISSSLFIYLYVSHELSYDKYHKDCDRIFRVFEKDKPGKDVKKFAQTPYVLAEVLRNEFSEISDAGQFQIIPAMLLKTQSMSTYNVENNICIADQSILNIFSIPFVRGNPKNALTQMKTAVITESLAHKYFGQENPVGKELILNRANITITGVVKDPPTNTHWKYGLIVSIVNAIDEKTRTNWALTQPYTYIKLKPHVDLNTFSKKLTTVTREYIAKSDARGVTWFELQPVTTIHLYSDFEDEIEPPGDINQVIIFSTAGILILLIACLNFINLSVARSITRAREVGIRKVAGSSKRLLTLQFLCESFLTALLSSFAVFFISESIFPLYKKLTGIELKTSTLFRPHTLLFIFIILIITGIVFSLYPAFITSRFNPIIVLKSSCRMRTSKSLFRKILVLLQFAIAVILFIVFIHVDLQLGYMKNHSPGIDKNQKLIFRFPIVSSLSKNYEEIKRDFLKNPDLKSCTLSSQMLGDNNFERFEQDVILPNKTFRSYVLNFFFIDPDFIPSYGIKIIAGRNFSKPTAKDEKKTYLVNWEAAKMLFQVKNPGEVIGKPLYNTFNRTDVRYIIGVTENFHYKGLQHPIEPLIMEWYPSQFNFITMTLNKTDKTDPGEVENSLKQLKQTWKEIFSDFPFEYYLLKENFNEKQYKSENLTALLLNIFSIIGQLLACLGLLGLTTFLTQKRTKEIGIRKALGESTLGITFRISKEFLKWVALSNLLAWPAAYIAVGYWLKNFAYHIDISIWPFIISGVLVFLIAALTVSFQTIRAASSDPVKSLRYE